MNHCDRIHELIIRIAEKEHLQVAELIGNVKVICRSLYTYRNYNQTKYFQITFFFYIYSFKFLSKQNYYNIYIFYV